MEWPEFNDGYTHTDIYLAKTSKSRQKAGVLASTVATYASSALAVRTPAHTHAHTLRPKAAP